jgi:hypothetical protein
MSISILVHLFIQFYYEIAALISTVYLLIDYLIFNFVTIHSIKMNNRNKIYNVGNFVIE